MGIVYAYDFWEGSRVHCSPGSYNSRVEDIGICIDVCMDLYVLVMSSCGNLIFRRLFYLVKNKFAGVIACAEHSVEGGVGVNISPCFSSTSLPRDVNCLPPVGPLTAGCCNTCFVYKYSIECI